MERLAPLLPARQLLVASDFDGTLARLDPDPWRAQILPAAQRALRRLAVTPGVSVALISGRTVTDLVGRVRVGGISYRGDHGAEHAEAGRGFRPAAVQALREPSPPEAVLVTQRVRVGVPDAITESWLVLEDKSTALTFHFRSAPDVDAARTRVLAAVDAADPEGVLQRSGGRRSVEVRPPGASTKADALRGLMDELTPDVVLMLGDDLNDALAFDALRARRRAGRIDGLAVAVAGHPDVTSAVAPRADLVMRDPVEAARLLARLVVVTADNG